VVKMIEISAEETGSKPAPGELALVQAFVNTADVESGSDDLPDPPSLGVWLGEHGLLAEGEPVTEGDLGRALVLREALRGLALANNGDGPAGEPARELNRVSSEVRLSVSVDEGGRGALRPAQGGVDGALGRLLATVYTAMAEGTWERFKACARHTCRWAFYDKSKNRCGNWCSMDVCGNREKAKAYRRRHREPSIPPPSSGS